MAIEMHCNLRPSDVGSVILGFTYDANNAPDLNFKNFARMSVSR